MTDASEDQDKSPYEEFRLCEYVDKLPHPGWRRLLRPIAERHAHAIDAGIAEHVRIFGNEIPVAPAFPDQVLRAFQHFDLPDTKVVIIGQDCYPTPGNATGLCFSVPNGTPCPASLRNVFKELEREYGVRRDAGDLSDWADQGVLLLNTALTVRCHQPGSHMRFWWGFTSDVVEALARETRGVVFLLWGAHAIEYEHILATDRDHTVLKHSHPSPLSRKPFEGCGHFEGANAHLRSVGKPGVTWC